MNKAEMRIIIMVETIPEQNCKSVFVHNDDEEITKAFTSLWTQVINQKENQQYYILQTKDLNL